MSNNEHPITPPPNLRQLWAHQAQRMAPHDPVAWQEHVANQAARWGYEQRGAVNEAELQQARDEELEACEEWIAVQLNCTSQEHLVPYLRAARRPKPLSDKEQALADLDSMQIEPCVINGVNLNASLQAKYQNIRRALEALPDD